MHDHVTAAFITLATSAAGSVLAAVGGLFAASGGEFAPWAQVGGTATAVGALAYMAKMMVDGKLVSLPVAEIIKTNEKREGNLEELVEKSNQREDALRALLMGRAVQ